MIYYREIDRYKDKMIYNKIDIYNIYIQIDRQIDKYIKTDRSIDIHIDRQIDQDRYINHINRSMNRSR